MTKEIKGIIDLFKKQYDINVTFDPISSYSEEVDMLIDNLYYKVHGVKKVDFSVINKLKDMMSRYPDIPIFYNYLYAAYFQNGMKENAENLLDKINSKFPDYIFGITQRATNLVLKGLSDEAIHWIGKEMDIKNRFPKDCYHFSELKSYYLIFFELALEKEDRFEAKRVLKILWELYPDENELLSLVLKYHIANFSKFNYFEHSYTSTDKTQRTLLNIPVQAYDQDIFEIISSDDFFDEPQLLTKYESNYLCGELYKICISLYHNFESLHEDDYITVTQAFQVLSTSNYNDAFSLFITYLSQDKDFIEYFWEDADREIVEIAFNFGKNNPELLLEFVMKEDVEDKVKADIFESLVQLVLHGFLSEDRLKSVYHQLMDKYLSNLSDDLFVPTYLLTLLIPHTIDLNDISLLEKAKPFFEANKIDTTYYGSFDDHLKEFPLWELRYVKKHFPKDLNDYISGDYLELNQTRPISDEEKMLFDAQIEDKFEQFLFGGLTQMLQGNKFDESNKVIGDDDMYDDDIDSDWLDNSTPIVKSSKIGRNDPCPCGSGKKFKKCCIKNDLFK